MRNFFRGYYRLTDEEIDKLWEECTFVFDTNVLLHIYRYSEVTRNRFFEILDRLKDRIWLPYQVASEFFTNRLTVITEQSRAYVDIIEALTKAQAAVEESVSRYRLHPIIDKSQITSPMKEGVAAAIEYLQGEKTRHPDLLLSDEPLEILTNLFDGKIGQPPTPERLQEIFKDGATRYDNKVPPGYEDKKDKQGDEKYGDLVLWLQTIEQAKQEKKPIVFVTDETKEDWWWERSGKTLGPRPELRQEMQKEAQVDFHMYRSERFVAFAQNYLKLQDEKTTSTNDEAREVSQAVETEEYDKILARLEARKRDIPINALLAIDSEFRQQVAKVIDYLWREREGAPIESTAVLARLKAYGVEVGPYALLEVFEAFERLRCIRFVAYLNSVGARVHGALTITYVDVDCLLHYAQRIAD
jgi:predicted nucleic acid-binding protein